MFNFYLRLANMTLLLCTVFDAFVSDFITTLERIYRYFAIEKRLHKVYCEHGVLMS